MKLRIGLGGVLGLGLVVALVALTGRGRDEMGFRTTPGGSGQPAAAGAPGSTPETNQQVLRDDVAAIPGATRVASHIPEGAAVARIAGPGMASSTPNMQKPQRLASEVSPLPQPIQGAGFEEQRGEIEALLASEPSRLREELLARYGRSSVASGRFERAAAAYTMFLDEFGWDHPYSARIAMRLAECLAPLELDSISIQHTPEGPTFHAQWRMNYVPPPERLRQAVAAYQLAAKLASKEAGADRALLMVGWIHRALNEWDASTEAWDRCAAKAAGSNAAAEALWLAAENLSWTGRPAAAAERLCRLANDYPGSSRAAAAAHRMEDLEAEARRGEEWLANPVASLEAEIADRSAVRTAPQVYRSVINWLRLHQHRAAEIAVSRWACTQTRWPIDARIACHHDLAGALLYEATPAQAHRQEAAQVLGQIITLAPDGAWAVPAAIRRSRLLSDLGRFEEADQTLDEIAEQAERSSAWHADFLSERIQTLLDRGQDKHARAALEVFSADYPQYHLAERFTSTLPNPSEERSK